MRIHSSSPSASHRGLITALIVAAGFAGAVISVGFAADQPEPAPAVAPGAATKPIEERFEVTTIDAAMPRPIEIAVAPDGRVFLIGLAGDIRVYHPDAHASVPVGTITCFADQENGLLGIALDPQFMTNSWIYFLYSPPGKAIQRISRFTLVGDKLDMTSEKIVLEYDTQREQCCHHAGALSFGPDGCLYASSGDNTHPFGDSASYAPLDWRPGRSPWDSAKSAGNTNDLRGKVLRVKPKPEGGYTIPEGNLFPPGTPKTRPEIYVMGCRNPWKMNVDQKTGYVYWGEVGPDANGESGERGPRGYDEINQARAAGNFGWPFVIADNKPYRNYDFATHKPGEWTDPKAPINDSPNNTGLRVLPPAQPAFIWYPYGGSKEFPEVGSGGRTACAGPVYYFDPAQKSGCNFPAYYNHTLFIYEWSRNWIKAVHLDSQDHIQSIEAFMPNRHFIRPVDIKVGPRGEMYVLEFGSSWGVNTDSKLSRIEYFGGNRAPLAKATATNAVGQPPLKVTFSSEGTIDKDGDKVTLEWRLAHGGPIVSTEPNPTLTFDKVGVFDVELSARDPQGAVGTTIVPVRVGNTTPTVAFDSPHDGQFYDPSQPLPVSVTASDPEDGKIDAVQLTLNYAQHTADGHATDDPPGLALIRTTDCLACHAVDHKIIGPAFLDVANKYRNDPKALDVSLERVTKGSSGVWGPIPMLPHPQHTPAQLRLMIGWVYSLQPPAASLTLQPGKLTPVTLPSPPTGAVAGALTLQASYTDRGGGPVGVLTGTTTVTLRPFHVEAEAFDGSGGLQVLPTPDGGPNGKMLGGIHGGAHAVYRHMNLESIDHIVCRVASAGSGGRIEFHAGAANGPLLGSVDVKPTGAWDKFVDVTAPIKAPAGAADLYVVFQGGGEGLMNLNWMQFEPAAK